MEEMGPLSRRIVSKGSSVLGTVMRCLPPGNVFSRIKWQQLSPWLSDSCNSHLLTTPHFLLALCVSYGNSGSFCVWQESPLHSSGIRETSVKCSTCGVCVQSRSDLFPLTAELPPWFSVQEQEKLGTQKHANTDTHTHTHTQTRTRTHAHTQTCRHTQTHKDTHRDTHTDIETHRHTQRYTQTPPPHTQTDMLFSSL